MPTPFESLCDAYSANRKSISDPVQMFYFLRGVLYQWCAEHWQASGFANVAACQFEMEYLFLTDIHGLARQ